MTHIARKYDFDCDEMFGIVKEACISLGLPIAKEDAVSRRLQVSTGLSALSWGETMDIIVSQQKGGAAVVVDSDPKVWFNFPASNRASRNAEALFKQIEKRIQSQG